MRISDWSSDVCSSDLRQPKRKSPMPMVAAKAARCALQPDREGGRSLHRKGADDRADKEHAQDRHDHDDRGIDDRLVLRSEEHTSELQSLMRISYAVFCLKKKKKQHTQTKT